MGMLTENNKALKEWASVIRALKEQRQIILFRKGGIIESNDCFEVESPEFFLYPTYLHQSEEQLQQPFQSWVKETERVHPDPKQVEISLYAKVEKVLQAKGIERLRDLTDCFIWTPDYVEKSWSWAPNKPAYILFLRVYELEKSFHIEERLEYGGCASWIDLHEALPVNLRQPIMEQAVFDAKCTEIIGKLHDTAVVV